MSASLIGHLRSSTFRLSTTAVSMSLTGSRFSSESAPRPFHYGIRGRGGTIFGSALPLHQRQVQADIRTHLIHRPARDIFPRLGGTRVFSADSSLKGNTISPHWKGWCDGRRLHTTDRNVSTILRQPSVEFKLGCLAISPVD